MSNLIDIQSQIQKLQKQAAEIRAREFDATVQDILSKMAAFGITVKDLQVKTTKRGKVRDTPTAKTGGKDVVGKKKGVKSPVAPKYTGPNGESWSGRGLTPRWLASLIEQGKSKEDFAIKKDSGGNGGPLYEFYLQNVRQKFVKDDFLTNTLEFFPSNPE